MDPWSIAAVVAGYLIGSVDFGVVVPRLLGVDIYEIGSGNPGTTNVLRSMGRGAAVVVLVGDILKGLGAAALGAATGSEAAGFAAGLAAVVGHCYPIWHRFKGGKGVATSAGMMLWMSPILGAILLTTWALITLVAKRASVASLLMAIALVPGLVIAGHRGWPLIWAGAASLLILYRHRENIVRLLSGSEYTIEESP
ncbi:MAG: glycerol-3-phosphate 1-O-acyltransferase PlsY [Actinobacteria bacterium]|nr:glycerol-3-phosphate 1-O-acyltransferase PlsY [Actinomycetota bacterium]MBU1493510.1 glycerol-3-phosphate 1-O-acyltransferase PlsY [Actinomycetota bacterium]